MRSNITCRNFGCTKVFIPSEANVVVELARYVYDRPYVILGLNLTSSVSWWPTFLSLTTGFILTYGSEATDITNSGGSHYNRIVSHWYPINLPSIPGAGQSYNAYQTTPAIFSKRDYIQVDAGKPLVLTGVTTGTNGDPPPWPATLRAALNIHVALYTRLVDELI